MTIDLILQNPNLLPREEVRIETVTAAPYPDGKRVNVVVTVTPFRERPNLEITILDSTNKPAASTSAIEIMNFRVSFNLHLRGIVDPAGEFTVRVQLYYDDFSQPQDTREIRFQLSS